MPPESQPRSTEFSFLWTNDEERAREMKRQESKRQVSRHFYDYTRLLTLVIIVIPTPPI